MRCNSTSQLSWQALGLVCSSQDPQGNTPPPRKLSLPWAGVMLAQAGEPSVSLATLALFQSGPQSQPPLLLPSSLDLSLPLMFLGSLERRFSR